MAALTPHGLVVTVRADDGEALALLMAMAEDAADRIRWTVPPYWAERKL